MKKRLFIDMDGTVAKWTRDYEPEEYLSPGFSKFLPEEPALVAILNKIAHTSDIEIFIISACCNIESIRDKVEWLNEHMPFIGPMHRIFVPYGENKSHYVENISENDYLLDDYTLNLTQWKGTAIKWLNGRNGKKGTWNGFRISNAHQLEEILIPMVR